MIATVVFSIGLNVGTVEPAGQLSATLRALAALGEVHSVAMGCASWQGAPERFIQGRMRLHGWHPSAGLADVVRSAGRSLASRLSQDCVAVLHEGMACWDLIDAAGQVAPGGSVADFPVILP